ncbi:hypothetical protein BHK69_25920 [Bosea vaviloviae]|uniref:Uncharacterized protein n=1 Tax=Bosea vaviloviae TaxID=1526658 RepID=A0A1D7U7Q5_9HYPH|nr:hypothetical protein BHK69_25920 [Bosea vaviloviae]
MQRTIRSLSMLTTDPDKLHSTSLLLHANRVPGAILDGSAEAGRKAPPPRQSAMLPFKTG